MRDALRRLAAAETPHDQRVIVSAIVACLWIGFWTVHDRIKQAERHIIAEQPSRPSGVPFTHYNFQLPEMP